MDKWYFADQIINIVSEGMENGDATAQLLVDKLNQYDEEFIINPLSKAAFVYETCICQQAGPLEPEEVEPPEDDEHDFGEDDDAGPLAQGGFIGGAAQIAPKKCGFCLLRDAARTWAEKWAAKKRTEEILQEELRQAMLRLNQVR